MEGSRFLDLDGGDELVISQDTNTKLSIEIEDEKSSFQDRVKDILDLLNKSQLSENDESNRKRVEAFNELISLKKVRIIELFSLINSQKGDDSKEDIVLKKALEEEYFTELYSLLDIYKQYGDLTTIENNGLHGLIHFFVNYSGVGFGVESLDKETLENREFINKNIYNLIIQLDLPELFDGIGKFAIDMKVEKITDKIVREYFELVNNGNDDEYVD